MLRSPRSGRVVDKRCMDPHKSLDEEPAPLSKDRLPAMGYESYDSMEGLIAIDASGPPQLFA